MKTKTIDARTAYAEVLRAAEEIRCDAHETIATMSPGDVLRQGDLYITCSGFRAQGRQARRDAAVGPGSDPRCQACGCRRLRRAERPECAWSRNATPGRPWRGRPTNHRVGHPSARSRDDYSPRARRPNLAGKCVLLSHIPTDLARAKGATTVRLTEDEDTAILHTRHHRPVRTLVNEVVLCCHRAHRSAWRNGTVLRAIRKPGGRNALSRGSLIVAVLRFRLGADGNTAEQPFPSFN